MDDHGDHDDHDDEALGGRAKKQQKKTPKTKDRANAQMVFKRYAQGMKNFKNRTRKKPRHDLDGEKFTLETIWDLCSPKMRAMFKNVRLYTNADAVTPIFTFDAENFALMDQFLAEKKSTMTPKQKSRRRLNRRKQQKEDASPPPLGRQKNGRRMKLHT